MEAGIWTIWDRNPTSNELKQTNMYKVGDKVKVRSDLQDGIQYGRVRFKAYAMAKFVAKLVTIRLVDNTDDTYKLVESSGSANLWYSGKMFEDNPSNKLLN